jgi:hypothetical protein
MTVGREENIGKESMNSCTSIDTLGPIALGAITMNCTFKRGGHLFKQNVTSFF